MSRRIRSYHEVGPAGATIPEQVAAQRERLAHRFAVVQDVRRRVDDDVSRLKDRAKRLCGPRFLARQQDLKRVRARAIAAPTQAAA